MFYKTIIRPLMFCIDPEKVHHWVVAFLKVGFKIPFIKFIVHRFYSVKQTSLKTQFCGIDFPNRVGLAPGFDKNALFFNEMVAFDFGFIEIGTVTPRPQPGNAKPRIFRLKADEALINRMGFNNLGVEEAVHQLKENRKGKLIIGGNIGKNTDTPNEKAVDDYIYCFERLYDYVDYFVVNVSCPNVSNLKALQDHDSLDAIMKAIMQRRNLMKVKKPVLLKISPDLNFDQVDDVLGILKETATDGMVVANTTVTREHLTTDAQKVASIGNGGLSGKPLKNRSTELIKYIAQKTNGQLPIIGSGGIIKPADALEKLNAGATLVQVYTGFIYYGPSIVKDINKLLIKNK